MSNASPISWVVTIALGIVIAHWWDNGNSEVVYLYPATYSATSSPFFSGHIRTIYTVHPESRTVDARITIAEEPSDYAAFAHMGTNCVIENANNWQCDESGVADVQELSSSIDGTVTIHHTDGSRPNRIETRGIGWIGYYIYRAGYWLSSLKHI